VRDLPSAHSGSLGSSSQSFASFRLPGRPDPARQRHRQLGVDPGLGVPHPASRPCTFGSSPSQVADPNSPTSEPDLSTPAGDFQLPGVSIVNVFCEYSPRTTTAESVHRTASDSSNATSRSPGLTISTRSPPHWGGKDSAKAKHSRAPAGSMTTNPIASTLPDGSASSSPSTERGSPPELDPSPSPLPSPLPQPKSATVRPMRPHTERLRFLFCGLCPAWSSVVTLAVRLLCTRAV
jgi:hypothetical protein